MSLKIALGPRGTRTAGLSRGGRDSARRAMTLHRAPGPFNPLLPKEKTSAQSDLDKVKAWMARAPLVRPIGCAILAAADIANARSTTIRPRPSAKQRKVMKRSERRRRGQAPGGGGRPRSGCAVKVSVRDRAGLCAQYARARSAVKSNSGRSPPVRWRSGIWPLETEDGAAPVLRSKACAPQDHLVVRFSALMIATQRTIDETCGCSCATRLPATGATSSITRLIGLKASTQVQ